MRRAIRIDRSVDFLRPRVAAAGKAYPYRCSSCTYQSSSFSTSPSRPADKKIPFTEKIRRKIWGTDQPPGLEDPYGSASVFDRTKQRAKEEEAAERAEQVRTRVTTADLDPSYVPASTWDGLERVGGFGNWWKENWDPEHQFEGFLPRKLTKNNNAVTAALHRAMVEVFALREAGIPLSEVSKTISTWDPTKFVQLLPSVNGASLQFPPKSSLDQVIQSLTIAATESDETAVKGNPSESEADVAADRSSVDPLHPTPAEVEEVDETAVKKNPSESEADVAADRSTVDPLHPRASVEVDEAAVKGNPSDSEANVAADRSSVDPLQKGARNESSSMKFEGGSSIVESWDAAWLDVSLADPKVKFAVLKRTMQLTGIRIPDPVIKSSNTAQALLKHLITPPKPTKVVEALNQKEELAELPNVTIYAKRRTPVDKERSVGRWKLIEKELRERGLPVFGKDEGIRVAPLPSFSRRR